MQNSAHNTQAITAPTYRERLTPSLWTIVAAAVVGPMAALVFAPIDSTLSLVAGAIVGAGLIGLLVTLSPVVEISNGMLRAGRARIPVDLLGEPKPLVELEARAARGQSLDPRGFHVIRGGIDGVVVMPVIDPDDPVSAWTISSRTPDRLAAALVRARSTRRTPGR